jgi:hypothetical protein
MKNVITENKSWLDGFRSRMVTEEEKIRNPENRPEEIAKMKYKEN